MALEQFDAIVIGAGQAGGPLSSALAKAGYKTAIIEREHVGGTCINEGCTPTKTMVASARVAYLARRGADYGVHTGAISIDMAKVRQRKRDIVNSFRSGSERRIVETKGDELIMGEASFTGPKQIVVRLNSGGTRELEANLIFINTGARPSVPKGFENVPTLNSTTIMELDAVPDHLMIIGGGYVGLEFGQMFRRFGSRVTIIQRGARLLGREDADVADEVAKIMREDGIDVLLDSATTHAEQADGKIRLTVKGPTGEQTLIGSHLLTAAGRTPNTDKLNLAATGLQPDKNGFLPANERLETAVPGIYTLGDVKGGPAFTHISYDDYRIIRTNLIEKGNATIKDRLVPYTVFIDPQLGRVGLGEEEAKAQGRNFRVVKMPMNYVARAEEIDETRGFMKAIVDADTKQILGCTILGIEGGEVMAMVEIAMLGKLPYTTLRDAIFAHPTLSEALNNLFSLLD
jgi:pyruvate/2-oxoglutarate dehydrogenase complex dihydrolipoamide dehydrogenase (E3) component